MATYWSRAAPGWPRFRAAWSIADRLSDAIGRQLRTGTYGMRKTTGLNPYDVVERPPVRCRIGGSRQTCRAQRRSRPLPTVSPDGKMPEGPPPSTAVFSHKLGAHLAGLGCTRQDAALLITPEHGPARALGDPCLPTRPSEPSGKSRRRLRGLHGVREDLPLRNALHGGRNFVESGRGIGRFALSSADVTSVRWESAGKPRVCGLCLYVLSPTGEARKPNERVIMYAGLKISDPSNRHGAASQAKWVLGCLSTGYIIFPAV